MDFELSLFIAGNLSVFVIVLSLIIYANRVRGVYGEVSRPVARALVAFGMAAVFLGLIEVSGLYVSSIIMVVLCFMLAAVLITELNLAVSNEQTVKRLSIGIIVTSIAVAIENFLEFAIGIPISILMIPVISIFLIGCFALSIYLLKETPNPFTASIFILIVVVAFAAVVSASEVLIVHPEYFIAGIIPLIVGAAILSSMLRPWRHIISYSIAIFAVIVGLSLAIPAFIDGDMNIVIFSLVAMFAGAATVLPFDFFVDQATETKAATPMYISLTLMFVAILAITHSNNYAISYSPLGIWDPTILYIDWFFGMFGVCFFTMAAIATNTSVAVTRRSREFLIGVGCILLTLGHPFVQDGRWDLNPLYLVIFVFLIGGFIGFLLVVYRLSKAGAGRAGARFLLFMFASLALGIVAMFADEMPVEIAAILLGSAGVMLIASSPRTSIRRN